MKPFLCSLLVLIFLCGCTPGAEPDVSGITETAQSSPSQSTEDTFSIVCHKAGATYDSVDTSEMKEGALYTIENGKVWLIAENVNTWHYYERRVFYVTQDEPNVVKHSDRYGRGAAEVYRCHEATIIHLQYADKLMMVFSDEQYGYTYHWISAAENGPSVADSIMGAYRIEDFRYAPSTAAFPDIASRISKEDWGETIWWKGKLSEADTEPKEYYYCVRTRELWDAVTFQKAPNIGPHPHSWAFVYNPTESDFLGNTDVSDCKPGALYYWDQFTQKMHLVCEDPVIVSQALFGKVFFVKAAEPAKIYAAPLHDLSQQTVVYQSQSGPINRILPPPYKLKNMVLQITEDNKRLVWLDIATGSAEILLEQYYMDWACVDDLLKDNKKSGENWQDYVKIYFVGKLHEGEQVKEYLYIIETGKIWETLR